MVNVNIRNVIIAAANRIVAENGLSGTTIEAVASAAGVSKGGLLYYFPSKKELLLALLEKYQISFFERRDQIATSLPDKPNRLLKATVLIMLRDMEASSEEIPNMSTVLEDPAMRTKIGEFKRTIIEEVSVRLPSSDLPLLAMYMIDGIWMDLRFSPEVVDKESRRSAAQKLVALIDAMGEDTV